MLYAFFWVIPRGLNFICWCFETLCLFHLSTRTCLWRWNRQSVPKRWHIKFRHRGITQKKTYNIQNTAKVWNKKYVIYAWHLVWCTLIIKSPRAAAFPSTCHLSLPCRLHWSSTACGPGHIFFPRILRILDGPRKRSPRVTSLVTLLAIPMILFFPSTDLGTVDPTIHAQALHNG